MPNSSTHASAASLDRMLQALRTEGQSISVSPEVAWQLRQEVQQSAQARQTVADQAAQLQELGCLMDLANVVVCDLDGRITRWTSGAGHLYGFTPEQALGQYSHDLLKTEFPEPLERIRARLFRAGRWEGELVHRRQDGQRIVVASQWMLRRNDRGQPVAIIEVNNHITERKRMEEALRESRDRLALAIEAAHAGLALWNLQTGEVEWNPRTFQIMGHQPDAFQPTYGQWRSQVHPEDIAEVEARFWQCARQRQDFSSEHRILWPNGEVRWVRLASRLDFGPEGQAVRSTAVVIDITSLKRAEEQMRKAKNEAEAAGQAKDQFLAVLSHELRTPLTPVLTTVQMLQRDQALSDPLRESINMIRRNVELETRLIDDLLDLTRISRGKLQLDTQNMDLHEKVCQVVSICESDIRAKQLGLTLHLNAGRHHVRGDPARLQQVLWNLLKNAVKFTPFGGDISISTADEEGKIAVAVKDTGIGIEAGRLARVFDAFEQGSMEVTRLFGGLGLGLSICRGLVDLHGGSISAASEGKDRGATFTVRLPVAAPAEAATAAGGGTPVPMAALSCRILLVEDHADTAKAMRLLLASFGCRVQVAGSVASALRLADAGRFDLLISDLGLPDGSGHDLMRQLRPKLAIKGIALSGYGTDEDVRKSLEAGFAVHLTKPINVDKLEAVMRQILVSS